MGGIVCLGFRNLSFWRKNSVFFSILVEFSEICPNRNVFMCWLNSNGADTPCFSIMRSHFLDIPDRMVVSWRRIGRTNLMMFSDMASFLGWQNYRVFKQPHFSDTCDNGFTGNYEESRTTYLDIKSRWNYFWNTSVMIDFLSRIHGETPECKSDMPLLSFS